MSTKFKSEWLVPDPKRDWSEWLQAVPDDKYSFYCKLCKEKRSLSNMGKQAVISHASGKKHLKIIAEISKTPAITNIFPRSAPPSSSTSSSSSAIIPVSTPLSINIDDSVVSDEVSAGSLPSVTSNGSIASHFSSADQITNAEILWALKCVASHFSYNSSLGISELFRLMFPDSKIANGYSMSYAKLAYGIAYGLGSHFKKEVETSIQSADEIVVCFDEAFNRVSQEKQMDLVCRFWDNESESVAVRYLTSLFLGHGTAEIILENFKDGLRRVPLSKILQISMDGPNVNWKFYDLFNQEVSNFISLTQDFRIFYFVRHMRFFHLLQFLFCRKRPKIQRR